MTAAFASVVIDADSTLCGIEGIDWLASLRGATVASEIARLTDRAMSGEIPLDAVYGERLNLIRPTRDEITRLGDAYCRTLEAHAAYVIATLGGQSVEVRIVSSGIRQALEPVVTMIKLETGALHAVSIAFGDDGAYAGYDESSLLTRANGKATLVDSLSLPRPTLAVGDGATDLAMRSAADRFAAFTGFVRREPVVRAADIELRSFLELRRIVLDS